MLREREALHGSAWRADTAPSEEKAEDIRLEPRAPSRAAASPARRAGSIWRCSRAPQTPTINYNAMADIEDSRAQLL